MTDPLAQFLTAAGWAEAVRQPLAGDASARRYLRLREPGGERAILMIAPGTESAGTARFLRLARHLQAAGLSAPRVLAENAEAGLVLLEDLGDDLLARLAETDPAAEIPLYRAAVETLAALQHMPLPAELVAPDANTLAAMIAPAAEWYLAAPDPAVADKLGAALRPALASVLAEAAPVFAHRDFHAENLIWLPQRSGPTRIGLLDFQDAFAAPPAYDLVSLVEDARRDLGAGVRDACLDRFAALTGQPRDTLDRHSAVLGAQRNLRILGVFGRLSRQAGKPRYIDLLPRVWRHLQTDLAHPALADLLGAVAGLLPPPDPVHLDLLRTPCQTSPTP